MIEFKPDNSNVRELEDKSLLEGLNLEDFDDEEVLYAEGLEDALMGYTENPVSNTTIAVYDEDKVIDIFMERDGMSEEEACEYFDYNVKGAYVGECTPVFVCVLPKYAKIEAKR